MNGITVDLTGVLLPFIMRTIFVPKLQAEPS